MDYTAQRITCYFHSYVNRPEKDLVPTKSHKPTDEKHRRTSPLKVKFTFPLSTAGKKSILSLFKLYIACPIILRKEFYKTLRTLKQPKNVQQPFAAPHENDSRPFVPKPFLLSPLD